jgi:molybdopterin-containing oxidoreductase family iron-sulfur binding subunit
MKRSPHQPFPLPVVPEQAVPLWRSLEEKAGAPSVLDSLEREFPPGAALPPEGLARRELLSLVGATMALAGAGCVTRPAEQILPYTTTPPGLTPGNPLHYATAVLRDALASGLLVTSREGRPVKVEGNPEHPTNRGATGPQEQALTLQLYDPSRARLIRRNGAPAAWRTFLLTLAEELKEHRRDGGARLRFLVEPTSSPTLLWLRERIADRFPESRAVAYAPAGRENVYAGAALALGQPCEPHYHLDRAQVVVSLDSDFLRAESVHLRHARQFADRRDPEAGPINRLYSVEGLLTLTGGMADHRLRLRSSEVGAFAVLLAGEVARLVRTPLDPALGQREAAAFAGRPEVLRFASAVARDLAGSRGAGLVIAGRRQPPPVHAVAHAINAALDGHGQTVTFTAPATPDIASGPRELAALCEEMRAGKVDTLCITSWNPVYGAPANLELAEGLKKVRNVIYRALHEDETAPHCAWFLPATHPLESWGDARAPDGTVSIVQPLISPLFSGITELELFAAFLAQGHRSAHDMVREYWRAQAPAIDFDRQWEGWLARGVVPDTASPPIAPAMDWAQVGRVAAAMPPPRTSPAGLELELYADTKVGDGRFSGVSWLQELPDPVTKLTWDNAALVSPRTAAQLQVGTGDTVDLWLGGRSVRGAPVLVLPGLADGVVGAALGYGRSGGEPVARGVGFNAGAIRLAEAPWFAGGLSARPASGKHRLAITQQHWSLEGRDLALEQTIAGYQAAPGAKTEHLKGPLPTLLEPAEYEGYRWGMAVDLSRCTGCSACVVACQAENNVPAVGKEQVLRSREMHWLRIDRYFKGESVEDPEGFITQPMLCQHCETAPCEYVCPVNATVHSDEGLNEMVYNRCIGTRYCANNCPYKVRRFNYFHYHKDTGPLQQMGMNPDVTVRARGVMEKCTYCVQRIERTRIDARVEGRRIQERELQTACQQACPTAAIVFGDLNDPEWAVSSLSQRPRRYNVLHDLDTRPRTFYLVRIKNPNPELERDRERDREGRR